MNKKTTQNNIKNGKTKKYDLFFCLGILMFLVLFFIFPVLYQYYQEANRTHPYILAFFKFAVLATAGEYFGLRLQRGKYNEPNFGFFTRAMVWGVFGIWIAAAIKLYAIGVSQLLETLGVSGLIGAMSGNLTWLKLLGAFSISVWMNTTFAPVFMTCHKIIDAHILQHGGSIKALMTPIYFGQLLSELNWKIQWNFVFKKTIPFFWIPAHTITFLLPTEWQVLFAALLSVVLGILLSIAAIKQRSVKSEYQPL